MKKKIYIIAAVIGLGVSILGYGLFTKTDDRPVENTAYTNVVINEYEAVNDCFETPFN